MKNLATAWLGEVAMNDFDNEWLGKEAMEK
jgi:hypothetical protein